MIGAKVVLVPRIVERCQLIVRYRYLGVDWLPIKVISGQVKNGLKPQDLQLKPVTFESEVEGGVQSFTAPPSSAIKLSH
jgi:hypothetical protein